MQPDQFLPVMEKAENSQRPLYWPIGHIYVIIQKNCLSIKISKWNNFVYVTLHYVNCIAHMGVYLNENYYNLLTLFF